MARGAQVIGAAVGLVLLAGAARADAFWFGDQVTRPIGVGGWYVGTGAIGGLYQLPRWNAPIALFKGTFLFNEELILGAADRTIFHPVVPFAGPGLTVGRYLPAVRTPDWAGSRLRVYLSGMYWAGRTSDNAFRSTSFSDALNLSAIDGRTHRFLFWGPRSLEERLRTRHRRVETLLGAATDYQIAPGTVLSPSVALVGGWQRERYRYDAFTRTGGIGPRSPLMYDERNSTIRVGLDTGLTAATRASPTVRLFATVRAGLHWLHSRMRGRDCFDRYATGTICDVPAGTFTTDRHATSASDSASAWSFRGSLAVGLSWNPRPFIVQLGSFFTWESAVPGITNPVLLTAPTSNGVTRLGPARIRFASGWNLGGYLVLRIPLGAL